MTGFFGATLVVFLVEVFGLVAVFLTAGLALVAVFFAGAALVVFGLVTLAGLVTFFSTLATLTGPEGPFGCKNSPDSTPFLKAVLNKASKLAVLTSKLD